MYGDYSNVFVCACAFVFVHLCIYVCVCVFQKELQQKVEDMMNMVSAVEKAISKLQTNTISIQVPSISDFLRLYRPCFLLQSFDFWFDFKNFKTHSLITTKQQHFSLEQSVLGECFSSQIIRW